MARSDPDRAFLLASALERRGQDADLHDFGSNSLMAIG
jgi:hypothetical protein